MTASSTYGEVAALLPVAVDRQLFAGEQEPQPPAEERLARVLHAHPRPERVGQPENGDGNTVDVFVDEVIPLARQLVDPVDVHRAPGDALRRPAGNAGDHRAAGCWRTPRALRG